MGSDIVSKNSIGTQILNEAISRGDAKLNFEIKTLDEILHSIKAATSHVISDESLDKKTCFRGDTAEK